MSENKYEEKMYYQICNELIITAENGNITNSNGGIWGGRRISNPDGEPGHRSETINGIEFGAFSDSVCELERFEEISYLLKDISNEGILSNYSYRQNYISFDGTNFEQDTLEVIECIASDDPEVRTIVYGKEGKLRYADFKYAQSRIKEIYQARRSARKENITGNTDVLLDSEAAGLLTAMLVGYFFEGDRVAAGTSYLFNNIERCKLNPLVTVIDKVTPEFPVYFTNDEEGTLPEHEVILINEGKIGSCVTDCFTSYLLNSENNGRSRSQDYRFVPLPRIANVLFKSGTYDFKDLLDCMGRGIYCIGVSGAAVDVASGVIHMNFQAAYNIENGEIAKPISNTSLSINVFEFIQKIKLVGNDLRTYARIMGKGRPLQNHIIGFGSPHLVMEECYVR